MRRGLWVGWIFVDTQPTGATFARDVVLYTVARLVLVAVPTLLLVLAGVPLLVAALLALVLALPLSLLLLRSLRARVAAGIQAVSDRRRTERTHLRNQLRG